LREHLGRDFSVEIAEVDRIPQERNGKYRFSICRLGTDRGGVSGP
jgi:hypothetical protein